MEPHLLLSASTLQKNKVKNLQGEDLGNIEEIMLDTNTGHVSYAVLSLGGLLGLGDKLLLFPGLLFLSTPKTKSSAWTSTNRSWRRHLASIRTTGPKQGTTSTNGCLGSMTTMVSPTTGSSKRSAPL
ncbi:MAG: PRC-barrel domain containing protein [Candidatus Latescibacteria bacterium]|nr:PRC-barrel domain containing protein [Candidatus Latescibacterota bacterium]